MPPLNNFTRSCLAIAIGQAVAMPLQAADIVVNSLSDASANSDGICTLREATISANNDFAASNGCVDGNGADTISFTVAGTILFSQPSALLITDDLVINGPGSGQLTIDGNNNYAPLTIFNGPTVTINGLTITGGSAAGGVGVYDDSIVDMNDVHVTGNAASQSSRSAGFNVVGSTLTLTNSTVSNNTSTNIGGGGGFNGKGADNKINLYGSVVEYNTAAYYGGAFRVSDTVVNVSDTTISGNSAVTREGGAFYLRSGSSLNMNESLLFLNRAVSGNGGGIAARANTTTVIDNSIILSNASGNQGGGINFAGSLTVNNSSFVGNYASSAGGAIAGYANATISNSTFSGNTGDIAGALFNEGGTVDLLNSTITENTSRNDGASGGGFWTQNGGAINLKNTLVVGNICTGTCSTEIANYSSTVNAGYNNLFGDSRTDNSGAFSGFTPSGTDINGTTNGETLALANILAPLEFGGPTYTHALVVGSRAIGTANGSVCTSAPVSSRDQRGSARSSDCDIGAFELSQVATITVDSKEIGNIADKCTLTSAIGSANGFAVDACTAGDDINNIVFDPAVFSDTKTNIITLTQSLPSLFSNIHINQGGETGITLQGIGNNKRILDIAGTTSINRMTLTGASVTFSGAAIVGRAASNVTISNSTISGNTAGVGGGITFYGAGKLINSTVSSNAAGTGAGIAANSSTSDVEIISSTISNNSASSRGGGIALFPDAKVSLLNSILSGNHADTDMAEIYSNAGAFTSRGFNVLGDNRYTNSRQAFYGFPNVVLNENDINATSDGNTPTELSAIIEPLGNNGGPTQTHGLVKDSPALDAGDNSDCGIMSQVSTDQRGEARDDGACDIGSVEGVVDDGGFIVIPLGGGRAVVIPQ